MHTSASGRPRVRAAVAVLSTTTFAVLAAVGGALLVALGTGLWAAGGVALLALPLGGGWALVGPRSPDAEVRVVEHAGRAALHLPARPGHVVALCLFTAAFGAAALLLGVAAVLDGVQSSGRRSPAVGVLAGPPFLALAAWMTWRAARGRGGVLLTDDALVLTSLIGQDTVVPWRHLHSVAPGPLPSTSARLATRVASDRWHSGPPTLPVGRIAWRWQQTLAVVAWCDREKQARRVLRDGSAAQVRQLAARVDDVARQALLR
ncbi:hypothetical protein [Nocardioides nanhaiensis]|uniref:PH domain-containing protein n=1 Tax=Nocardioides nanhaiensis TaxID=1476871 RepID=A0ABP8W2G8_9ACTN